MNVQKQANEAAANNFKLASLDAENLLDESTAELEKNISDIEELNKKIRANLDREKAEIDAEDYRSQYTYLTEQIEDVRQAKTDLLSSADLPLEGLSVEDGELLYNGHKWDSISGAEQLIVATSIVRKLNPDCGFVLLDKLEQMDTDTLDDFGKWLEEQGLQRLPLEFPQVTSAVSLSRTAGRWTTKKKKTQKRKLGKQVHFNV